LDIVSIAGKANVAPRLSEDRPRFQVGDYVAVLTEGLLLSDRLLRQLDLWDADKQKGLLAGARGNRTQRRRVGGVLSEVSLCKVTWTSEERTSMGEVLVQSLNISIKDHGSHLVLRVGNRGIPQFTPEGIDVGWMLEVKQCERNAT
jgi:hypothetical protein